MKKTIIYLGTFLALILVAGTANAQMMRNGYGMMGYYPAATSSVSASQDPDIAAGRQLWSELQAQKTQCSQFTTTNFNNLGDYFMQQMMGSAHQAMEQTIINQSGQAGLDAMHVAMGERFSGCNPNAAFPTGMMGCGMPMMGLYGYYNNGASSTPQNNNPYFNMMGYGYGPMMGYGYADPWGWVFMVLFWVLIIVGIIVLVRWLGGGRRHGWHEHNHSALDILKERYAKGEIDKKEFEDKKKDLS